MIALRAFGQDPGPADGGAFDELPARSFFPDAMVLVSRKPGPGGGLSFAAKGGTNGEMHNHNDLGSYSIVLDGEEMCGDPGGVVYTRDTFSGKRYENPFLGSFGHPVPLVDGRVQMPGAEHAAKVLRSEFSDARDVVEYDLRGAYDVPYLESLVRKVVFDRNVGRVTIEDRAEFSRTAAFEVPVVTGRDVEGSPFSGRFLLRHPSSGRALSVTATSSSALAVRQETLRDAGRPQVLRIGFSPAGPVKSAVVAIRYEACP